LIVVVFIVFVKENIENNNLNKMLLRMFCCFCYFCFVVQVCLFKFFFFQQNMLRNILKTYVLKSQNFLSKHCLFYVVSFSSFLYSSSFLLHLYKPPKNLLYFLINFKIFFFLFFPSPFNLVYKYWVIRRSFCYIFIFGRNTRTHTKTSCCCCCCCCCCWGDCFYIKVVLCFYC